MFHVQPHLNRTKTIFIIHLIWFNTAHIASFFHYEFWKNHYTVISLISESELWNIPHVYRNLMGYYMTKTSILIRKLGNVVLNKWKSDLHQSQYPNRNWVVKMLMTLCKKQAKSTKISLINWHFIIIFCNVTIFYLYTW